MKVKIVPMGDYVLFKKIEQRESWCWQSEIHLYQEDSDKEEPAGTQIDRVRRGKPPVEVEVMAVGPGRTIDGEFVEPRVKAGDRALISHWVVPRREILIDGNRYALMPNDSYAIMAILEKGE